MPIPKYLTCSKVPQALRQIAAQGLPPQQDSTDYCLVFENKHFAPKTVVSITHLLQTGQELPVGYFHGGRPTNNWLRKCGYEVIKCPCHCGGHGKAPNH